MTNHYTDVCEETIESLRQHLVSLKNELKDIGKAIDDPRTDLTMTMSEIIVEQKKQLAAALDDLEVAKNVANGNVEAKFDVWKQLDAMEHELDAALEACKAKDDIILEVLECESTTRPPIRLREALAATNDLKEQGK